MAQAPRNKILPHLKPKSRFGEDAAGNVEATTHRRPIRRMLAGLALFVALFAIYPLIQRQNELNRADGVGRVTPCDRLAAHPWDSQKLAPGVSQDQLDVAGATTACAQALRLQPNDGRTLYQLARAHLAGKADQQGLEELRQSAAAGYAQGEFTLGLMLVEGGGIAADPCAGGRLWLSAARQRHLYAKIYLANTWHGGMFKACGLDATDADVSGMLATADDLVETPRQESDLKQAREAWER